MKSIIATALAGLMVVACSTTEASTGRTSRDNTRTGALIGAIAGAAIGCATNTNSGEQCRKNALIGAGVGALAGAGVGRYMDQQQAALEQELSETGVGVKREGENIRLVMPSDITFPVNESGLQAQFLPILSDVAGVFNEYPATYVDVYGHADSDGADDYNLTLSQQRAASVAQALINNGVIDGRFVVRGFGETQPIASNDTAAGKAQNRRVEILLRPYTG